MVFPLFGVDSSVFLEFPDLNVRGSSLRDLLLRHLTSFLEISCVVLVLKPCGWLKSS